ncbi:hypothetical protein SAMN05428961_11354 [Paenibacillus sp. OK060]|uniref:hypothetical protein n=1 Tax=Paenibacillus sp. OK060 TaxID=1881034 RepID=UPI00087FD8A1|nr:hypothetical protein [Paenibacillus sp. OK060]SDM30838.1 hypothetical protein SAMN05428961_11354 [Paenibacillus sp. OK060]
MKKSIIVTMLGTMLLYGCGVNNLSSSPAAKVDEKTSESVSTSVKFIPNTLLSETSDKKIAVYGIQEKGDLFSSLDVAIKGETKTFDWSNVTNPSFYPQISVIDLNEDGEDEIIIILTKGTGTGIHNSEVHVLKRDFTEILVMDPKEFIQTNFKVSLKTDKDVRQYTISVDGQKYSFEFSEMDSSEWFKQPTVQNIIRYGIKDNELIAELPIQISAGNYLGDAIVRYSLVNGKLETSKIQISKEGSSL